MKSFRVLLKQPGSTEAAIWLFALLALACIPTSFEGTFSMCLLHNAGFEDCPGCGLGRSISYLLHGRLADSWHMHKLGIPAVVLMLFKISTVLHRFYTKNKIHE